MTGTSASTMWQKNSAIYCIVLLLVQLAGAFFLPASAQAASLPAIPIAQRFSPPDPNGDYGVHTCMAAALTSALKTMVSTGQLNSDPTFSYSHVRQLVREISPTISRGIAPSVLFTVTPQLTRGQFHMTEQQVSPTS